LGTHTGKVPSESNSDEKIGKTWNVCQTAVGKGRFYDKELEANLSIMMQEPNNRQSELQCMVREWGSPTFF